MFMTETQIILGYQYLFIWQGEVEGDAVTAEIEVNPEFLKLLIRGYQQLTRQPQSAYILQTLAEQDGE